MHLQRLGSRRDIYTYISRVILEHNDSHSTSIQYSQPSWLLILSIANSWNLATLFVIHAICSTKHYSDDYGFGRSSWTSMQIT